MEFVSTLTRKNSLRSAVKELDVASLEKVASDLSGILSEVKEKEADQVREEQLRQAKINEIKAMMADVGISTNDLGNAVESKTRAKVRPKYRLMGADGKPREWSGRGRTPVVFREYQERGGNLEDLKV